MRFFFLLQGQRLHQTPNKELEKFGIFNGNHIILIGPKVSFSISPKEKKKRF
jgi:hypothetical protein